jgi:hypothetical protein
MKTRLVDRRRCPTCAGALTSVTGLLPVPVAFDAAAYERRFGMPLIGIGRRGSRSANAA